MRNCLSLVAALVVLAANVLSGSAGTAVVEVRLGVIIERTWEQVQAAKFAYGPKQEFVTASGETHLYLPYGKATELYHEARGVLTAPSEFLAKEVRVTKAQDSHPRPRRRRRRTRRHLVAGARRNHRGTVR